MARQILLPSSRHQESFAAAALAIVVDDLELVAVGELANTLARKGSSVSINAYANPPSS